MNNALQKFIRPHYLSMKGYSSAGMESNRAEEQVFLNANENPYPLPGLEGLNRYPEPQPLALLEAFAKNYGVQNNQIAITRGADEAISVLMRTFCEPHKDRVLITPPTFGIYGVDAQAMPCETLSVPLVRKNGTFLLDHKNIIAKAKDPKNNVKLVFLCSPNNPSGTSFSHDIIGEICEELEGYAIVVLDEAYAEFSKLGSFVGDMATYPNVIILRTLSKAYALAGMRMGCMLCADTDFVALVQAKVMETYPLPCLSIEAAFHALSPEIQEIAAENISKILVERDRCAKDLATVNHVKYIYPSDANFLLFEMENAASFCAFCKDSGVHLRDFSTALGAAGCVRFSIGTPEENDLVLALLEKF